MEFDIRFRHEYERRLRVAVVGCGGHAYRNILPALNFLPVELLATCDIARERAAAYARIFGAASGASRARAMGARRISLASTRRPRSTGNRNSTWDNSTT